MTVATETNTINQSADFWRYDIGVNVIPADTINKKPIVCWSEWQDKPIPEELHNQWKAEGLFSNGIAIIPGQVWHREDKKSLFFIFIDADKQNAINEICTRNEKTITLNEMAEKFLVEQHKDNPEKAHIYFYSPIPFPKKSADTVLGLEVKGVGEHGIAFCFPSIHKDGMPYDIIGTNQPEVLNEIQALELIQHIDQICIKHGLQYLESSDSSNFSSRLRNIITTLVLDTNVKIPQGQRHVTLISVADSLLFNHLGKGKRKTEEWLKDFFDKINCLLCKPELLPATEANSIWNSALGFVTRVRKEQNDNHREGREKHNSEKESQEQQQQQSQSSADILVQLATEHIQLLFKDQYSIAYALIQVIDHDEVLRVESNKFKRYLSKLFYDNNGNKVINADSIMNAIQVLQAKAEYEGKSIPLCLRVAWYNNGSDIYYDMADEKWRCIRITKEEGWKLVSKAPSPLFVRYNQTSQSEPDRNYEASIFDRFLDLTNIKSEDEQDKLLLKIYIVSLFIPDVPHVMLVLHGEKGSAKSTLQTLIKLLVDPSKPTLVTIHNDRAEFIQQLAHNYVVYYDNVKHTPGWLSDEACKAVTGIGQTKRKLYTDDDDIVYEYKRCLGFNGINISITEPDALDRSMMIELKRIVKEKRRVESEIIGDFLQLRPKLLAYIFDILVKTLQLKPTIKLDDLPRMADFALWGEAIARAMGYKELEFINAYYDNIGKQNIEAVENHPLGQAISKFFEKEVEDSSQGFWQGSPAELLEQLEKIAQESKINTNLKSWPKEVRWLTRRLNQIRSNLLEGLGIEVIIDRLSSTREEEEKKKNTSYLKIRKITPLSPLSPPGQNHGQNQDQNSGDILAGGQNDSTGHEMTPRK